MTGCNWLSGKQNDLRIPTGISAFIGHRNTGTHARTPILASAQSRMMGGSLQQGSREKHLFSQDASVCLHLQQFQRMPFPASKHQAVRGGIVICGKTESRLLLWFRQPFCLFSRVIAVLYKQVMMRFLSLLEACFG